MQPNMANHIGTERDGRTVKSGCSAQSLTNSAESDRQSEVGYWLGGDNEDTSDRPLGS
jgi:hypothetical protein